MKISTVIEKDYFACFDEARGFNLNKRRVVKRKLNSTLSYIQFNALLFIVLLIFSMFFCMRYETKIALIFYVIGILFFVKILADTISVYIFRKKQKFSNTIILDKHGITDESYHDIKITIKWDKVLAVVFGKYTVTILTDTPIYFYFSINKKKEIMEALKKYDVKGKIIK